MPVHPFEIAETQWLSFSGPGGNAATAVALALDGTWYVLHRGDRSPGGDGELTPEPVIVRVEPATGKVLG